MNIFEAVEKLKGCTDEKEAYVLNSMIEEMAKSNKEMIKPVIEESELGSTMFEVYGKSLDVIEMQKSTLDQEKIKGQLSDDEIRSQFKVTETAIKNLKRKDLLTDEYKSVELVRQVRVTTLKKVEAA